MVRNTAGLNNADLIAVLDTVSNLNAAQRAALVTEVNTDPRRRGYDVSNLAHTANLLNSGYSSPNNAVRGRTKRASIPQAEFRNVASKVSARWVRLESTKKDTLRDYITSVLPSLVVLPSVDPSDADVSDFLTALVSEGVFTQEAVDAFTMEPDPSYESVVDNPSRASVLFGANAFIEIRDLKGAGF